MRAVSLFAGIGGFDLALQRAGIEVAAMVEIDKACQAVLRRHFPKARGFADIKNVDGRRLGRIDLVVGGFPCQDVSVAGKRAGLAGERTGLFFEAARIINETTPQYVILENVPGLLSSNGGRDMGTVLGTLEELGYGLAYRILDAQYFGVAQRRRRVFIVGSLGDWDGPREILFEPESLRGDSATGSEKRTDIAAPLTRGSATGRGVNPPGRRQEDDVNIVPTLRAGTNETGGTRPPGTDVDTAESLQVVYPDPAPTLVGGSNNPRSHGKQNGSDRGSLVVAALTANGVGTCGADDNQAQAGHLLARTLTSRNERLDGDTETFITQALTRNSALQPDDNRAQGNFVVPAFSTRDVAPALTSNYGKQPDNSDTNLGPSLAIQNLAVRRLTPRECERLQGFPDDWTTEQSDAQRYRQLGNAVAVPVVEWIARRLVGFERCRELGSELGDRSLSVTPIPSVPTPGS